MKKLAPLSAAVATLATLALPAAAQEEPPAGRTDTLTVSTKLARSGTFSVQLRCQPYAPQGPDGQPYGGTCRGTYNVRGNASRAGGARPLFVTSAYEVPMGQDVTLTLRLNRRGRRAIEAWRRPRYGALQEVVTGTQVSGRSLNLILPRKRRRR